MWQADSTYFKITGPEDIVGVSLPRTPALIAAVLAIHKTGAAYMPLDPTYPADRIAYIVADSGAKTIITTSEIAPSLASGPAQLIRLDQLTDLDVRTADLATSQTADPENLAYVLYTSGSTGNPKAVGIEHRNAPNFVRWGRSVVDDVDLTGMLFSTSLNFDISVFEIFVPLAFGGAMIMAENLLAVATDPHKDSVRLINASPSLFDALLRTNGLPIGTRTVALAGEPLPRPLADRLFALKPDIRLFNFYGPTETTVYSTAHQVQPMETRPPPIGKALWNTSLYVLGADQRPASLGEVGELYIGGAGVGRGYLNRPELTAERFIANPVGPGRLYRTGDLARWESDGELQCLGRADNQIKMNGLRIEPGEIEAALQAVPGIAAAVVILRQDGSQIARLIGYLVAAGDGPRPSDEDIRRCLVRTLPRYMLPSAYAWLDAFPMTPNGKLDRAALPAPGEGPGSQAPWQGPQTRVERELFAIWGRVLQFEPASAEDDFFRIGGDSLAAINLVVEIEKQFGVRLTGDILMEGLTIAHLAQRIDELGGNPGSVTLIPLQPLGDKSPFYCVHSVGGDVMNLYPLAEAMGLGRPFVGIGGGDALDPSHPHLAIEDMAARYVEAMLAYQPEGPIFLGGYSLGASIAYEMACQLVKKGHAVGFLALIDSGSPDWHLTIANVIPALARFLSNLPAWWRSEVLAAGPVRSGRSVVRKLRSFLRWAIGRAPQIDDAMVVSLISAEYRKVMEAHFQAYRAYRPGPYPGRIWVFRAHVQPIFHFTDDEALGWTTKTHQSVEVHDLPGTHDSIIKNPNVQGLARALCGALKAVDMA